MSNSLPDQISSAWGSGPSQRYETLAAPFRPIFTRIRETAVEREVQHILPFEQLGWLKEAGFTAVRLPEDEGGKGANLPELFNLLIELSAADPNVTNALRGHFGFGEDVLTSPYPEWRTRWVPVIASGETFGNGFTEGGNAKLSQFSTRIEPEGDIYRLNGAKAYTTGSLLAEWISIAAVNHLDQQILASVPTRGEGVTILDDWDGFGQQLTASGNATFENVALNADYVNPNPDRFKYSAGFYQVVHLATLAGIGRSAADDVAKLVRERRRTFSHGNAPLPKDDAQILQVVGKVRGAAYAAGAIVLKTAEALQRVHDLRADDESATKANHVAEIEIAQAVTVVSDLIFNATTILFDALGASSAARPLGLDRHWRNARTIATHNPRVYKDRIVGDFAVNGAEPPSQWRIGIA